MMDADNIWLAIRDGEMTHDEFMAWFAQQVKPMPADPMDTPIPCDLVTGGVTIKKGCKFRTVQVRLNSLHKMVVESIAIIPHKIQVVPSDMKAEDTDWAEGGSVF